MSTEPATLVSTEEDRQTWRDIAGLAPTLMPLFTEYINGDTQKAILLAQSFRLKKNAFATGDEKTLEKIVAKENKEE